MGLSLGAGISIGTLFISIAAVVVVAIHQKAKNGNSINGNGKNNRYRRTDTCDAYRNGIEKQLVALNSGQEKLFGKLDGVETQVNTFIGEVKEWKRQQ